MAGYLVINLAAVTYGATDELLQAFVRGRHADWWDWIADIGGAAIGIAAHRVSAPTIARLPPITTDFACRRVLVLKKLRDEERQLITASQVEQRGDGRSPLAIADT